MDEINKKLLSELAKTPYGNALRDFLDYHYREIGDIQKSQSWEETLGRKFSLIMLKDLFAFMEAKKPIDKKQNQYV